jgi:hypothetical protein
MVCRCVQLSAQLALDYVPFYKFFVGCVEQRKIVRVVASGKQRVLRLLSGVQCNDSVKWMVVDRWNIID